VYSSAIFSDFCQLSQFTTPSRMEIAIHGLREKVAHWMYCFRRYKIHQHIHKGSLLAWVVKASDRPGTGIYVSYVYSLKQLAHLLLDRGCYIQQQKLQRMRVYYFRCYLPSNLLFVVRCVTYISNLRKIGLELRSLSRVVGISDRQTDRHIRSSDICPAP